MPNWCSNILTIHGPPEKIEKFIKVFSEKGFESYIPMPEPLKTYNTTNSEYNLLLNKLFHLDYEDICEDINLKLNILEEAQKIINQLDNEKDKKLLSEIISCLKTGYYSWYEFAYKNWGVKWNVDTVEIIDKNTVRFETPWNAPLNFLIYVSDKEKLKFHLIAKIEEEDYFFKYIIEDGTIKSQTKFVEASDIEKYKEVRKMGKNLEEVWEMVKEVSFYLNTKFHDLKILRVSETEKKIIFQHESVIAISEVREFNEELNGLQLFVPVVFDFRKLDGETLLSLLEENRSLIFGSYFIDKNNRLIGLTHNFLGDTLDPEEFFTAIIGMMSYANSVDEKLCGKTAGKRGIDIIRR